MANGTDCAPLGVGAKAQAQATSGALGSGEYFCHWPRSKADSWRIKPKPNNNTTANERGIETEIANEKLFIAPNKRGLRSFAPASSCDSSVGRKRASERLVI